MQQPPQLDPRKALLESVDAILRTASDRDGVLSAVVQSIHESSDRHDWTGLYLVEGDELVLHNHVGGPTPHVRIRVGEGICGAAAAEGRTLVVPDVGADERYLACRPQTRSEIVVPIRKLGYVFGEIDVDSDSPDAFDEEDRRILEAVAERLATLF
ncbi:MAG: GAF domain-containing protein [Acidobacteriota bacterium]|jgi:putative methionine-R-sulfoxide reductase with GAF domain